jgi:hypothetical protein
VLTVDIGRFTEDAHTGYLTEIGRREIDVVDPEAEMMTARVTVAWHL